MVRRVMLHLEIGPEDADAVREAAQRAQMRPSHYAVDRLCRVASYENQIAQETDQRIDIDQIGKVDAEISLLGEAGRLDAWLARRRKRKAPTQEPD